MKTDITTRGWKCWLDTKIFSLLAAGESPHWVEHEMKTSSFQKQRVRFRWFKLENNKHRINRDKPNFFRGEYFHVLKVDQPYRGSGYTPGNC